MDGAERDEVTRTDFAVRADLLSDQVVLHDVYSSGCGVVGSRYWSGCRRQSQSGSKHSEGSPRYVGVNSLALAQVLTEDYRISSAHHFT